MQQSNSWINHWKNYDQICFKSLVIRNCQLVLFKLSSEKCLRYMAKFISVVFLHHFHQQQPYMVKVTCIVTYTNDFWCVTVWSNNDIISRTLVVNQKTSNRHKNGRRVHKIAFMQPQTTTTIHTWFSSAASTTWCYDQICRLWWVIIVPDFTKHFTKTQSTLLSPRALHKNPRVHPKKRSKC